MNHKFPLTLLLLVVLIPSVTSLSVYVRPPRIIARMDVVPGKTSIYDGFLEVKNQNDFDVNVTLEAMGELAENIELSQKSAELIPDEVRTIDFTINLDQPGSKQGTIIVTYFAEDSPGVALQAEVIAIATEVEPDTKNVLNYIIIGFIVLVIIILVLYLLKKRGV
jgi:hypothetical protein